MTADAWIVCETFQPAKGSMALARTRMTLCRDREEAEKLAASRLWDTSAALSLHEANWNNDSGAATGRECGGASGQVPNSPQPVIGLPRGGCNSPARASRRSLEDRGCVVSPESYRLRWRMQARCAMVTIALLGEREIVEAARFLHRRFHRAMSIGELLDVGYSTTLDIPRHNPTWSGIGPRHYVNYFAGLARRFP